MSIKLVKLSTGEELVCKYEEIETLDSLGVSTVVSHVKLTNILKSMMLPSGDFVMMPFLPLSKEAPIELSREYIMFTTDIDDDVMNEYNSRFSNVILPKFEVIGQ